MIGTEVKSVEEVGIEHLIDLEIRDMENENIPLIDMLLIGLEASSNLAFLEGRSSRPQPSPHQCEPCQGKRTVRGVHLPFSDNLPK